ncbi:MAG: cytochrome c, partial [Planctomycetota bacterium]|nr:cytochrome c [Planctomycetota bacterium]
MLLIIGGMLPATPFELEASENRVVNFANDIAPIIHEKCSNCHRKGQVGPFELISFQDVRNRAATIQAVIKDKYMPPWKPVSDDLEYSNDRRLTAEEKKAFASWVESGMPAGDLSSIESPDFPSEWSLGEPDLVVQMKGRFEVPASGPDVYRSFVFPLQLEEDQWV